MRRSSEEHVAGVAEGVTVTTAEVTSITASSAVSGGTVTLASGVTLNARGVCWSESAAATVDDDCTSDGTAADAYTSSITNLSEGSAYYVRAYAEKSDGTVAYGTARFFTTLSSSGGVVLLPTVQLTVTTNAVSSITATTAVLAGATSGEDLGKVASFGLCYSLTTQPAPNAAGSTCTAQEGSDGASAFSRTVDALTPNRTYYVRAYAMVTGVTEPALGNEQTFSSKKMQPIVEVPTTLTLAQIEPRLLALSSSWRAPQGKDSDTNAPVRNGYCWGTDSDPSLQKAGRDMQCLCLETTTTPDPWKLTIKDLEPNTTYFIRAYVETADGAVYSTEIEQKTRETPWNATLTIGNIAVVRVNGLWWTMRNSVVDLYRVSPTNNQTDWAAMTGPANAYPSYNADNLDTYGLIYNGYAITVETPCTTGYRLPTLEEWQGLVAYYGEGAGPLKTEYDWLAVPKTNSTLFSALPAGYLGSNGVTYINSARWWAAPVPNPGGSPYVHAVRITDGSNEVVYDEYLPMTTGASIRCVRAEENENP